MCALTRTAFLTALCVMWLGAPPLPAGAELSCDQKTVSGQIVARDLLKSDDGKYYRIEGEQAAGVLEREGERVEISGTVTEERGTPTIRLSNCKTQSEARKRFPWESDPSGRIYF